MRPLSSSLLLASVVSMLVSCQVHPRQISPSVPTPNQPSPRVQERVAPDDGVVSDTPIALPTCETAASPPALHPTAAQVPTDKPASSRRVIHMRVTAYCPCRTCCGPAAHGVTASGQPVSADAGQFVAADTRRLPFDTQLIVPGYAADQPVRVLDRGGAIKGDRLDVFFPTHRAALAWGVRWLDVVVLR